MTPPPLALLDVVDEFRSELDEIESIYYSCRSHSTVASSTIPSYKPTEEGCLFALWDSWTRYLRSLVVVSASASFLSLGGTTHSNPTPRSESQLLLDLNANKRGRNFGIINDEPKWNDPTKLADIANYLGIPNQTQILSAVTATSLSLGPIVITSPLEEMRIARNYAAHKNPKTQQDLAAFSRVTFTSLPDHLQQRRSGVETFSEWKESLLALGEAAAQ
jgi:hypothetical protein